MYAKDREVIERVVNGRKAELQESYKERVACRR